MQIIQISIVRKRLRKEKGSVSSKKSLLGWYIPIFFKMFFDEHFFAEQL